MYWKVERRRRSNTKRGDTTEHNYIEATHRKLKTIGKERKYETDEKIKKTHIMEDCKEEQREYKQGSTYNGTNW